MTSGTAGAQAIAVGFTPIITRLYGPEAYGLLGTFMALVAVLVPVATLAYPIAIVLPRDNADARALVRLCLLISSSVMLLALVLFHLVGKSILSIAGAENIARFSLLIPLVMLFAAWLEIAQYLLVRHQAFTATARVAILHSLITNTAKCGAGLIYPFAAALIVLQTFGTVLHAFMLTLSLGRTTLVGGYPERHGHSHLIVLAKRYKDFPLYLAPQHFLNAVSQNLPVAILAGLFGPTAAGLYALGRGVMTLPATLVAQSVGTVFLPRVAKAVADGNPICPLIIKATLGLSAAGLLPFATVFAFGPWLFSFIFGQEWTLAGEYARWLSLLYFFNFINRPSVAAISVLGLQRGLLVYELFSTGTKFLALYLGFRIYGSAEAAVALFAASGAIAYAYLIAWVFIAARKADSGIEHA